MNGLIAQIIEQIVKYMSYKNFTLDKLKDNFGIVPLISHWLPENYKYFQPSEFLLNDLKEASNVALDSEKAKSEMIVTPVIKELKRKNPNSFTFFSGYEFNVDKTLGLKGFCDYIFSKIINSPIIEAPIFYIVEAKKGEVEEGFGQCGAEMYAAQIFNERHLINHKVIYGCVTNAFTWAFLKLENKQLLIDSNYVPLTFNEANKVLETFQWILDSMNDGK
jgi:hypothetical protein